LALIWALGRLPWPIGAGLSGSGLYNTLGRVVLLPFTRQRGLRFGALSALRRSVGGATMTTAGGAGTTSLYD
jgi:hypothetical protein